MPQSRSLELRPDTSAGKGHEALIPGALSDSPTTSRLPFGVSPLASVGLRGFQGLEGNPAAVRQTASVSLRR